MTSHPMPDTGHSAPESSVWPMVVAGGLTLMLFGLVTTATAFEIVGALAMLTGIVGWLREL
jgi:hypothetical protein